MIGGTVVKVIECKDRIWVKCEDDNSTSQCAIYVEKNAKSRCIEPGDCVWCEGGYAMWTPYCNRGKTGQRSHRDYDIRIPRIGFSVLSEPTDALKEGK